MAGMYRVLILWLGYPHSNCHHFLNPAAILNIKQHLGKQATHSSSCEFWQRREEESRDNSAGQNSSKPQPSSSHEPEEDWEGPSATALPLFKGTKEISAQTLSPSQILLN